MKRQLWQQSVVQFAVVAILLVLNAGISSAQEQYERHVRQQLDRVKVKLEENGFQNTHNYKIDRLGRNATDSFRVDLRKGLDYLLVSVCDKDCTDIDIRIYDENNNLIAEDIKRDDLPIVSVSPKWTGEFRIQVTMYKCSSSPCYYGIGVFGK